MYWHDWQNAQANHDYYTGSITEVKHLIQLDRSPCYLDEPRWEVYKISLSFPFIREYNFGA